MLNSNDSVLNQYAKLVKMLQAYRNNNLAEAVTYYEALIRHYLRTRRSFPLPTG